MKANSVGHEVAHDALTVSLYIFSGVLERDEMLTHEVCVCLAGDLHEYRDLIVLRVMVSSRPAVLGLSIPEKERITFVDADGK